ncbi:general odorant-binding protein 83a-like [Sitodiplosis mosellana]|uniref:general odorant-binding protein 83a-like n=1 Tax=Sitodiplosis mosellana TaxID=263140 RepID=UPI002443E1F2|nr:general odorant-binding protein 83a-like [Sitodiplosis mosellana]
MKIVLMVLGVVGLSLAALEVPEHLKAAVKIMRKACLVESGVDEKYVNQSRDGNLPDIPKLGCYILCFFEHAGMIEEDGTIHFNDVMHLLSPSLAETAKYVSEECKTIHGDTRCDTAWLTTKCFFEKAPEGSELP